MNHTSIKYYILCNIFSLLPGFAFGFAFNVYYCLYNNGNDNYIDVELN